MGFGPVAVLGWPVSLPRGSLSAGGAPGWSGHLPLVKALRDSPTAHPKAACCFSRWDCILLTSILSGKTDQLHFIWDKLRSVAAPILLGPSQKYCILSKSSRAQHCYMCLLKSAQMSVTDTPSVQWEPHADIYRVSLSSKHCWAFPIVFSTCH